MERSVGVLVLALLLAAPALAAESLAGFRVSVNVAPRATLEAVETPSTVEVSAADVARGYLELRARYRVRHNTPRGYLLQFAPRSGLARLVEIRGLDAPLVLQGEPAEVHRLVSNREHELALEFRVVLDGSAGPGRYQLPYEITALPL